MLRVFYAIFLKEYVKTRSFMLILLILGLAWSIWLCTGIYRLFFLDHPEIVWYHTMDLEQIPYATFAFVPVLSALVFCFAQFLPEMRDERMRISLHLPCPMWLLMLAHFLFGLIFLFLLYFLESLPLLFTLQMFYPFEVVTRAVRTLTPWCLAGIYAYLCCAYTMLEPQKKARLLGLVLGVSLCTQLLAKVEPGAFSNTVLCFFLFGLPLLITGLLLPAMHFRSREVQE